MVAANMVSVSIVTPTFNRGHLIGTAIDSAWQQSSLPFEHIVIDGASSDDTLQRLARFPQLKVISEPDSGLYDAINKGIRMAAGDVIVLLNSDDQLLPGAIAAAQQAFAENPEAASACGRVLLGQSGAAGHDFEIGNSAMQQLRAGDVISGLPLTNARFFRRDVFEKVGGFDQRFPVLADRDFLGRFHLAGLSTAVIDRVVYRYNAHPSSLTFGAPHATAGQLREAIELARYRLAGSRSGAELEFYRQWLTWAVFYAAGRAVRSGRLFDAGATLNLALGGGISIAALLRQLKWHLETRAERHGRQPHVAIRS